MRSRSLFVVCAVMGASSLASQAVARKGRLSDEAQRRAMLSQLAAASAEATPEQRTDADLMYEAMRQWRGEPAGSAAVDQTLAQSKQDAAHERHVFEQKLRQMFWKDPFSKELVAVRKQDRDLLADYGDRHPPARAGAGEGDVARLRTEVSEARADAAAAHAEVSRLRDQLAARDGDGAPGGCLAEPSRQARRHHGHERPSAERLEAWSSPVEAPDRRHHRHGAKPEVPAAAPPAPPVVEPLASQAPAGWQSSDPRGIIIVPIGSSSAAR